jgi:hypothetical protein
MHDAEEVGSPKLSQVVLGISFTKEHPGEVYQFSGMSQTKHTSVSIKVGSDAHVVYAHNIHGMTYVRECILDTGNTLLAKETLVEGYLHHATTLGQGTHLLVIEIAWVVAQMLATGMAAHNGHFREADGIVETLFRRMAEVNHHA